MSGIEGRIAFVTGASMGIGRGIARVFAQRGAKVVCASRNADTGEQAVREIRDAGGDALFVPTDVSRKGDIEAAAEAAVARYGRIDILVHNAGIFWEVMLGDMTEDDWDRCHSVNLKALLWLTQAVLPAMTAQKHGRILATSSITGPRTGMPGFAHYGAAKGGVNGFLRNAAVELARFGITVNGIEPGNILTEGLAGLGDEYLQTMTRAIPLGRLGSPEDVAHAMAFLASDEAGWITGQTLIVDGGQTLPESGLASP